MTKMDKIQEWDAFVFGDEIDTSHGLRCEGLVWSRKIGDPVDSWAMKGYFDKIGLSNSCKWDGVPSVRPDLADVKDVSSG